MRIRDRIKELRRVPAREHQPNPRNWRSARAAGGLDGAPHGIRLLRRHASAAASRRPPPVHRRPPAPRDLAEPHPRGECQTILGPARRIDPPCSETASRIQRTWSETKRFEPNGWRASPWASSPENIVLRGNAFSSWSEKKCQGTNFLRLPVNSGSWLDRW
jgi:hypothetical protein